MLLLAHSSWSQTVSTLPVYENFSYAEKLTIFPSATATANSNGLGPWSTAVTLTKDNTLIVATPSWTNIGLSTGIAGAALQIKGSGADPQLLFTPSAAGFGAIYSSFVMSVTGQAGATLQPTGAGGYFYGIASPTSKRAAVYLRFTEADKYQIGISTTSSSTSGITAWNSTILSVNDKNFVVVKYTESGEAFLFINPSISVNEPFAFQKSTEVASAVLPDRIYVNADNAANTPQIVIDEIRIAKSWSEAIGGSVTTPTASPVVEKRQVFSSASNPTVANLVAVGTVGTINWYSVLGGSALSPITSITSGTYYVTQTFNGVDSDPVPVSVFVGDISLKTLPLYEPFNYTVGDKLILMNNAKDHGIGLGSWSITPSANTNDDVTIMASPTWTNLISPASTSGNAITMVGSGVDPELEFTDATSGNLYSSFVFTATDPLASKTPFASLLISAQAAADAAYIKADPTAVPPYPAVASGIDGAKSTPTGFYSFISNSTDPNTNVVSTSYASSVMFRKNIATGKFNIGLSKSNNDQECTWSSTEYDFGAQYLIVISYENIGDATSTNQVANLWVNPTANTLPIPAPTLTNDPTTPVSKDHINSIKVAQASTISTPALIIDEIRVANNWGEALGGEATLGVAKLNVSKLAVYPNPVTNGKLYISSDNSIQKQVAIYSLLGQKVLETRAANNAEINVSKLAKGTYILNVTENGKSESKKLIIK
jgi:hypothetical protein